MTPELPRNTIKPCTEFDDTIITRLKTIKTESNSVNSLPDLPKIKANPIIQQNAKKLD